MRAEIISDQSENIPFSIGAFCQLEHNAILIKKAERIISEFAAADNTYLYLKNPDGTTIRVQGGCKLINAEYVVLKQNK